MVEDRGIGVRLGVLWDMDGTLVDTEPLWMAAETELVSSFGGVWTHENAMACVGKGLEDSSAIIQAAGVRLSIDEITRWLTDHVKAHLNPETMPWRTGAREFLESLRDAGIPTALVTMSLHDMAQHVADQLGFVGFDAIIAGDDVEHAKPHPDPYLRGAAAIGVPIEDCVAFEDSNIGLASAIASGACAIVIPWIVPIEARPGFLVWDSLAGRTVEDVRAASAAHRAPEVAR
ncbi:MAG TPA: HAD family phosphatase [Microbacteriaceae bacterium]|nr:HAD family phosphatase [Microbacteriaceae bacterium]